MHIGRNNITVAVWMVTYNHEKTIAEAIESVLIQKTSFQITLFIGEDCSTDNTREICIAYRDKYPDRIKLLFNEKNLGAAANAQQVYKACFESGAKYIALLEGDDYWTDPLKLQKQVDFLEQNLDYTGIHTKVMYVDKYNNIHGYSNRVSSELETITFDSLIQRNIIHTCSFVFKKEALLYNGKYLWEFTPSFHDIYLFLGVALRGNIKYINEVTSAYRTNVGIMQTLSKEHIHKDAIAYHSFFLKFGQVSLINKASILLSLVNRQYELLFILLKQRRKTEGWPLIKSIISNYKDYLQHKKHIKYKRIKFTIKRCVLLIMWLLFTNTMYHSSQIYNNLYHAYNRRNRPGA